MKCSNLLCSVIPRLRFKFAGLVVVRVDDVRGRCTNERPLHASLKATFDVARGPDVTSACIISPVQTILLKSRPSYLSGLLPNIHGLRHRRQAATSAFHDSKRSRNNVADRVGEFPSLRLNLARRPEETGRTRQSQSGGNAVFLVVKGKIQKNKKNKSIIIVIIPARLKSRTRVWFLPLIIVWKNAFKCLTCQCMTDAWIPLHTHSHFSHLDAKM